MPIDASGPIDPDRILQRTFATVRRGVDPAEVERYLQQIANQMRSTASRMQEMERELENYRLRPATPDPIDPSNLTKLLGEETTRVLDAAQSAAAEIRARAEENVARMLRETREESTRLREEAESLVARRTEEAEAAVTEIRERSAADRARAESEAAAILDEAKQQGRDMLAEAQQYRQRMLDDLSRRRESLREQIEQLQASRDRLSAAYDVVRQTLAVATTELEVALPDAPIVAEVAALRAVETESIEPSVSTPDATVTPIVTAEDLGRTAPSHPAEPSVPAAEPEPPRLTVVPPVPEPEPEAVAAAPEPEPELVPEVQPTASSSKQSTAPTEGRHSSSVRVVRSGKAADVFARLREEGAAEASSKSAEDDDSNDDATEVVDIAVVDDATVDVAVIEVTSPSDGAEADDQAFIEARNAAIGSIASSLTRRLKRELSDEQNELLATVGTIKGNLSAIALLPTPESQLERYEDLALPALADAAAAGADLAPVKGRGASRTSVGDLASELAASIVGPLRERLERAVAESGGDRDDLTKRIRSTFREWKSQRVDSAVEFSALTACNRGIIGRLPKSASIRWALAEGDDPSPDCEDNSLAGAVAVGQPFPTGHTAPPLHPGCHCIVVPV